MYCTKCRHIVSGARCPLCGCRKLRKPEAQDACFLTEMESIWTNALSDILTQSGIPYTTQALLGAGITARLGSILERTLFFVPYERLEEARAIVDGFFGGASCPTSDA